MWDKNGVDERVRFIILFAFYLFFLRADAASTLRLERRERNRDVNCYNIRDRTIVTQSARRNCNKPTTTTTTTAVKEKRNPLLDQVKHTGLTHFKPNGTAAATITTTAPDHRDALHERNGTCTTTDNNNDYYRHVDDSHDDDDDDDEDISTISGRLKAISDKYLKSSTHRFLAKFYKNSSVKTERSAGAGAERQQRGTANDAKVGNSLRLKLYFYSFINFHFLLLFVVHAITVTFRFAQFLSRVYRGKSTGRSAPFTIMVRLEN